MKQNLSTSDSIRFDGMNRPVRRTSAEAEIIKTTSRNVLFFSSPWIKRSDVFRQIFIMAGIEIRKADRTIIKSL